MTDLFHSSSSEHIPDAFIWPEALSESTHGSSADVEEMAVPVIDLSFSTDRTVSEAVAQAASAQGFFHVINHGVPPSLIAAAHEHAQLFFDLPLHEKKKIQRVVGESFGYASSFIGRFTSRLPWKETLSLQSSPFSNIQDYFRRVFVEGNCDEGCAVYEKYCQAMIKLGLEIIELLEIGLGLSRNSFTDAFNPSSSIMRLNYYPSCNQPSLTYGTGPHTDPTGLTILHQDHVPGLQVLENGRWRTVRPSKDAFVVNIGDTLMALSNKHYKSCLHRAVVNRTTPRRSLAFFLNPGFNNLISPPAQLVNSENPRKYLDFTWKEFLEFTQKVYRGSVDTLDTFNDWIALKHCH